MLVLTGKVEEAVLQKGVVRNDRTLCYPCDTIHFVGSMLEQTVPMLYERVSASSRVRKYELFTIDMARRMSASVKSSKTLIFWEHKWVIQGINYVDINIKPGSYRPCSQKWEVRGRFRQQRQYYAQMLAENVADILEMKESYDLEKPSGERFAFTTCKSVDTTAPNVAQETESATSNAKWQNLPMMDRIGRTNVEGTSTQEVGRWALSSKLPLVIYVSSSRRLCSISLEQCCNGQLRRNILPEICFNTSPNDSKTNKWITRQTKAQLADRAHSVAFPRWFRTRFHDTRETTVMDNVKSKRSQPSGTVSRKRNQAQTTHFWIGLHDLPSKSNLRPGRKMMHVWSAIMSVRAGSKIVGKGDGGFVLKRCCACGTVIPRF